MIPSFRDSTLEDALERGYDVIQVKYPGLSCKATCRGRTIVYSTPLYIDLPNSDCLEIASGVRVLGVYVTGAAPGTLGHFWAYDTIQQMKYVDRYLYLRNLFVAGCFPATWELVPSYQISKFDEVWQNLVENGIGNGVVFKRAIGFLDDEVLVMRCIAKNGRVL